MDIGAVIKSRRVELGMTQEDLARATYVTPQAVSQWENGKTVPDVFHLGLIAKALSIAKAALVSDIPAHPDWRVRDRFYSPENMYRRLKEFAASEDLSQTNRAIDFARDAHKGQVRKPNVFSCEQVPYIVHPFTMACQAHALGIRDDAVLATTLLHDVCEDCGIAPNELPFSQEVREAVALLTKPSDRSGFTNEAYYEAISYNSTAAIVKALDRVNNVSGIMASFSVPRIIEYVDETERYVLPLIDAIKVRYPQYYDATFVLKYQLYSTIESIKAAVLRL